jgi:5-(carboxyamino)imidazole ribonucleotide mutase
MKERKKHEVVLRFSMKPQALVGIVMGSDSDLPVMKDAAAMLDSFGVAYELTIVSAHRTPERLREYALSAHSRGLKLIIAGAGGAAHLPGMLAAFCPLPIIGVPVQSKALSGVDSLYSIVQMPPGVPVATVAINGAKNAGILAVEILAMSDTVLFGKIETFKKSQENEVLAKAKKLEGEGYADYLKNMP